MEATPVPLPSTTMSLSVAHPTTALSGSITAASASGRDRPEEAAFADATHKLITGECDLASTLLAYAEVCDKRARELEELAAAQAQAYKATRSLTLTDLAAELKAESATWKLLWFLYGIPDRDFPGGRGGDFVDGAGLAKTWHQLAADLLFQHDEFNRAARVVAWLEHLAEENDPEPEHGLARKDGVWQETKMGFLVQNQRQKHRTSVSRLDPDAASRQQANLHPDNEKDEERLSRVIWRLVKGGRFARAARACIVAGQPWRAASLAGGGPHGPLPLGPAAEGADLMETGDRQASVLCATTVSSFRRGKAACKTGRELWRWSCGQVARHLHGLPDTSSMHETAVYALLGGDPHLALPACVTWEDRLWVHLRCWLENQVEGTINQERSVKSNSFADAVEDCAREIEGREGERAAAQRFRAVQLELILRLEEGEVRRLIEDILVGWIISSNNNGNDNGDRKGTCDTKVKTVSKTKRKDDLPPPPGLVRFAAHLALTLQALGLLGSTQAAAYSHLHDLLQRLVQVYAVHLIDSRSYALVPFYACQLRVGLRRFTCVLLLEQLLADESIDAAGCWEVYKMADDWIRSFEVTPLVQDPLAPIESGNATATSLVNTVPEMAAAALKCVARGQMQLEGGPVGRARRMFWLCVDPYLRESGETVEWACTLCREFALGGSIGLMGASTLFEDIIPSAMTVSTVFRPNTDGYSSTDASTNAIASLEMLCSAAQSSVWATELRGWAEYFELLGEYESWRHLYKEMVVVDSFRKDSAQLFKACVDFVLQGVDWIQSGKEEDERMEEIAVVLGPVRQVDGEEEKIVTATKGMEYPAFPSAEQRDSLCAPISMALHAFADGMVTFYAGASPEHSGASFPGLISIAADCGSAAEVKLAAKALARLLKDGSDSCSFESPANSYEYPITSFIATNVSGSQSFVAEVCRRVIWTRMVLSTLTLRKALLMITVTKGAQSLLFDDENVEKEAEDGFAQLVDLLSSREDWFSEQETLEIRNLLAELTELSRHRRRSLDLGE